jgi:hypothetical protein
MNVAATAPGPSAGSPADSSARVNRHPSAMRIERTRFREWPEAYRCTVGDVELTVVVSVGPRILSLRHRDGENLLHADSGDPRVGEWRLYGGHRFTTAPESPASYVPDNTPCRAVEEDASLLIISPKSPDGLDRALRIAGANDGRGFVLTHTLCNTTRQAWTGALWAITGFAAAGCVVVPWGCGDARWRTQMVRYLVQAGTPYANATSRQWQPAADHFVVEPAAERGKIGLFSDRGWAALLRADGTFVKRCPVVPPEAECPDGGCNFEVFVGTDYVEIETLSALTRLGPGEVLEHVERWYWLRETFSPETWPVIESHLNHD